MNLTQIVLSEKHNVELGRWQSEPPKKKDFPLSCRSGKLGLSRQYRWSVTKFTAGERSFRLLTAYHKVVHNYLSYLAEALDGDSRVIARFDFHASERIPGWHVHANCEPIDEVGCGMTKPYGQLRIPHARRPHRRREYTLSGDSMNDNMALRVALDEFRIPYSTDMFGEVSQ